MRTHRALSVPRRRYSLFWAVEGRGRKSVTCDLRTPEGQDLFRRLAATADVVCENFRPGTHGGLGPRPRRRSTRAWSSCASAPSARTAPTRKRPGLDRLGVAYGGLLHLTGEPDRPPVRPGVTVADYLTGVFAAEAALAALYRRDAVERGADERAGRGAVIDASLYGSVLRILEWTIAAYDRLGTVREPRRQPALELGAPRQLPDAPTGSYVCVVAGVRRQLRAAVPGHGPPRPRSRTRASPPWPTGPATATPSTRWWREWTSAQTAAEVERACVAHDVPVATAYTARDIALDPHFAARHDLVAVDDPVLGPLRQQAPYPEAGGRGHAGPERAPALGAAQPRGVVRPGGPDAAELDGAPGQRDRVTRRPRSTATDVRGRRATHAKDGRVRALVFGAPPAPDEARPEPTDDLERMLAVAPVRAARRGRRPAAPRPDWVVTRPILVGHLRIRRQARAGRLRRGRHRQPHVRLLVAPPRARATRWWPRSSSSGPRHRAWRSDDRVVLNPWLTCAPRGIDPLCPACQAGDLNLCWSFTRGALGPGVHVGVTTDAPGAWADLLAAHDSMLIPVPDGVSDDAGRARRPVRRVDARHPPPPAARRAAGRSSTAPGRSGVTSVAALRALYPDVEVAVVARFAAQAEFATRLGATKVVRARAAPRSSSRSWPRGRAACSTRRSTGCPSPTRVGSTSSTTPSPGPRPSRSACACWPSAAPSSRAVSRHPGRWEWTPDLLQGAHHRRLQRLRHRGGRRGAQARHRPLPRHGRLADASTSPACSPTGSRSSGGGTPCGPSPARTRAEPSRSLSSASLSRAVTTMPREWDRPPRRAPPTGARAR